MERAELFYPLLWYLNFEQLLGKAQATKTHHDLNFLEHFIDQYIEGLMERRGHPVRMRWFSPMEQADHSRRFQVVSENIAVLEGAISVERSLEEMRNDQLHNTAYLFDLNFWFRTHFLTNILVISAKDGLQGRFHQVIQKAEVPWMAGEASLDLDIPASDLSLVQRMELNFANNLSHCYHTSG